MPYLIGGDDRPLLARLARALSAEPEVTLRRRVGAEEAPSLLVVEMTPARAEALKAQLGPRVTIEPDFPVEPSGRGQRDQPELGRVETL